MNAEDIVKCIVSRDAEDYSYMLGEFADLLDDVVWVLRNPEQYSNDIIVSRINDMRTFCKIINCDERDAETMASDMKLLK